MASPPPATKQMSPAELLTRLTAYAMLCMFLYWQFVAPHTIALPPEITDAHKALQANNLKLARRKFDALIGSDPQDAGVYLLIITECNQSGRLNLSLEYGLRGLDNCKYALNVSRAALYNAISSLYADSQEPAPQSNAQYYARRALEMAPDYPECLNAYGYILADNARTQQEVNVGLGYIHKALAILRSQEGKANMLPAPNPQVGADRQTLAETEDSEGWALYKRGRYDARDYARAADALTQAIDDLPDDTPKEARKIIYYHLGAAYRAAGRIEDARYALQVALFFDPKYPDALKELNALPNQTTPPSTPRPPAAVSGANGKPVFQPLDKPAVPLTAGPH